MLYSGIIIFVLTYYTVSFIVITDKVQSKYTVISSLNAPFNVHYCSFIVITDKVQSKYTVISSLNAPFKRSLFSLSTMLRH